MPSLFSGTDKLICAALGIQRREQLKRRALHIEPPPDETAARLVNELYERMKSNVPPRIVSRSEMIWHCRRATRIADLSLSREKMLEKAVAILAERGHMPGWFNQCPVAAGIADPYKDNKRAIDLVHLCSDTARLIELKWAGGTPLHALFQVLEYGLAYALARLHRSGFGLHKRPLMHARHVGLEIAGPSAFFAADGWPQFFTAFDKAIAGFAKEHSGGCWSMSLAARVFPENFDVVPFPDGKAVNEQCGTDGLSAEGRKIVDAFSRLAPALTTPEGRFLRGVPSADIERILDAAPGDEIGSGKFDSPESSAALAANVFGFFLHRPQDLPPLPGCPDTQWPARSLSLETTIRFPWRGGRHPVLDCLVATPSTLIGIESKRFEPYRDSKAADFSKAYWRPVWGDRMKGYERVRDSLHENARQYHFLDAAQLVKHAFGLRAEVHRPGRHRGLRPVLFYVHAEPEFWPGTGKRVDEDERAGHREEIARFSHLVKGDEVAFVPCAYRGLLEPWRDDCGEEIGAHAEAVMARFSP